MTGTKAISKLLKLIGLKVAELWFANRGQELWLQVKPHRNGRRCPHCGRACRTVRIRKEPRVWRDIPVCGKPVFYLYGPKEVECPTHGRVQEDIPWADTEARITYRLEYLVLVYAQMMTQKAAAQLLHLAPSTYSDILHRTITRVRNGHRIRGLKAIGVDEISYQKRHKYVTVVYDLDRSCVLWVGKGKGRATIDRFFNEVLSDYQKKQIQWACCDMSETYMGALKHHCSNAKLVLDHFHITKALHEALDEVRKEQWREATGDERKALKGIRWLLFKHPSKRTPEDKRLLETLRRGNRRIHRACVLKDEFDLFWDYQAPWAAKRFLQRWCTAALKSRLEPLRKFVRTLRQHQANVITFIESGGLTNAVAEGLNRLIKILKNRASGFRSVDAFIDLIYLVVGDVDIPAHIPPRFRTL
ncbi:MAG: ISL3 family transposase [bacterium]|nr:ISL3 family transposase [bacterium]